MKRAEVEYQGGQALWEGSTAKLALNIPKDAQLKGVCSGMQFGVFQLGVLDVQNCWWRSSLKSRTFMAVPGRGMRGQHQN